MRDSYREMRQCVGNGVTLSLELKAAIHRLQARSPHARAFSNPRSSAWEALRSTFAADVPWEPSSMIWYRRSDRLCFDMAPCPPISAAYDELEEQTRPRQDAQVAFEGIILPSTSKRPSWGVYEGASAASRRACLPLGDPSREAISRSRGSGMGPQLREPARNPSVCRRCRARPADCR